MAPALGAWAAPSSASADAREGFLAAVAAGDGDAVARYLEADPGLAQARSADGQSAFAVALLHRHLAIAQIVRDHGYAPDVHELALALDWPAFEERAGAAPGLLDTAHPIGGSAMYAAALGGAGSSIWRVYQFGADPDARPVPERPSPLRAALEVPDLDVAELTAAALLANGADACAAEPGGDSALHAAARRGSVDLVRMLVRKGGDIGARNAAGAMPIEVAEQSGHGAAVALLAAHHSIHREVTTSRRAYDVDGNRYDPPSLAAFDPLAIQRLVGASHFDLDAVRAAIDADPKLVHAVASTTEGAVEACAHTGRRPIVDLLLERGAPCSLPTAVLRGDTARVAALLAEDPRRVHERGPHDFALLWYPVIGTGTLPTAECLSMMERLLDAGADIEQQDHLGTTALHWAARGDQVEMVDLLLQRGDDPTRPGRKFGGTPQTALELAEEAGAAEAASLLRDRLRHSA